MPKANPRQWYGSGARDVQSENGAYRAPQPEPSVGGGAAPAGGEAAARGAAPAPAPREGRAGGGIGGGAAFLGRSCCGPPRPSFYLFHNFNVIL